MKALLCICLVFASCLATVATGSNDTHWAFKPPIRPPVPVVTNHASRVKTAIDAFIFAEHEKRGVVPGPEARKEVLLRRVYIDLVGLPPTREELHSFLGDTSSQAYEHVVERLLNSPQYAERWARHWMDIWRYSDWYGRRHVPDVWNSAPQVWRWRDWLVRSLNADKGYGRMIEEMLAADEIAPEDDDVRVATSYLVRNWYALNSNQWLRDVVEHTGKAFLGLTFNCAHCHDHKYDPLTQGDYFQFRAFFEPIQVRQDRVAGEPDPGPFQKYEYSQTRKVVTNGMVSVFDENLDAKTFIYLRGDERSLPEGKPTVEPAMPAFLRGDTLKPERIDLPARARYPGLKGFIQETETEKREQALAAAKNAVTKAGKTFAEAQEQFTALKDTNTLITRAKAFADLLGAEVGFRQKSNQVAIAQAELDAIRARIAADAAKYASSATNHLAGEASRAERLVGLRKTETSLAEAEGALALLQAEQAFASARRTVEGATDKKEGESALKQSQEKVATARKAVETAEAALKTNSTTYTPLSPIYPAQSTGRRRALAGWIASRENPLTARVAVNHIWARHFHAPLVASVFDFGRNGAQPTHPELLDWLAIEFMEQGWSMKHLHRLIVTSATYRQSSAVSAPAVDVDNKYLWRMNPGQMEAEVLRDSILHLAGELDLSPVGYPLPNTEAEKSLRRSLYFECFPEPGGQSQFAEMFDAPSPMECYRRSQTIVPQQALALTNSKLSTEHSRALAHRLAERFAVTGRSDITDLITAAYEQILTRRPTAEELAACRDFLAQQSKSMTREAAQAGLIHVLFNHNDFVTIR